MNVELIYDKAADAYGAAESVRNSFDASEEDLSRAALAMSNAALAMAILRQTQHGRIDG